jgi:hypothetical protein
MKIMDKVDEIHKKVKGGDKDLGKRIQKEGVKAVLNGIQSRHWQKYMENFHSNPDQLKRLVGEDDDFMNSDYGGVVLAYLAGNSTCGTGTTVDTGRNIPDPMKDELEEGVSDITEPRKLSSSV